MIEVTRLDVVDPKVLPELSLSARRPGDRDLTQAPALPQDIRSPIPRVQGVQRGGLCFRFEACHTAVVKRKQGPCPSRARTSEGPTLSIPSSDSFQLTMRVSVPCSSFLWAGGSGWGHETQFPRLASGLNPGHLQELACVWIQEKSWKMPGQAVTGGPAGGQRWAEGPLDPVPLLP